MEQTSTSLRPSGKRLAEPQRDQLIEGFEPSTDLGEWEAWFDDTFETGWRAISESS